jgi:hypothetical protein
VLIKDYEFELQPTYSAWKAYAPYRIVVCGLAGCTVFFHILKNGTIFVGKKLNIKYVF